MEKTLTDFDILHFLCHTGDEMDIAMCPNFVSSNLTKRGTEITMGAGSIASQKLMNNEWMPVLYLFNKKKFFEIKAAGKLPTKNESNGKDNSDQARLMKTINGLWELAIERFTAYYNDSIPNSKQLERFEEWKASYIASITDKN